MNRASQVEWSYVLDGAGKILVENRLELWLSEDLGVKKVIISFLNFAKFPVNQQDISYYKV